MGKITDEEMYDNLGFKCAVCGADCVKTSALEPENGYISEVNGEFVGPICDNCLPNVKKAGNYASKQPFETMFIVGVKPNGGGAVVLTVGIEQKYARDAMPYDIIAGCQEVVSDFNNIKIYSKILGTLMPAANRKPSALTVPQTLKRR